jgi:SAM-dependent methyltransferase
MASQQTFLTCYRGTQGKLRHMAYMRMAKVLFLQKLIDAAEISLEHKRVFDYGFGAGTFFHVCPRSASLFGVELDPLAVQEVASSLRAAGFQKVDLRPLEIDSWAAHPLLQQRYDVIVCSHVLEHLPDPVGFLRKMKDCLPPGGSFLALVPINEREADPHHQLVVTRSAVDEWTRAADFEMAAYEEHDPWIYWTQPLFTHEAGLKHKAAQAISVSLGIPATLLGYRKWFKAGRAFASVTRSRPMQAGFVLRRRESV